MKRPTVLVDVDDVTASLMPEWLRRYNIRFHRSVKIEDIVDWSCSCIPAEDKPNFYSILESQELYDFVQPVTDALLYITRLRDQGIRIVFVTSAAHGHEDAKLRWLHRYGFIEDPYTTLDYIEARDKNMIFGDLIVDDRPETCINFHSSAILFETPANRNFILPAMPRLVRARGWEGTSQRIIQALF